MEKKRQPRGCLTVFRRLGGVISRRLVALFLVALGAAFVAGLAILSALDSILRPASGH